MKDSGEIKRYRRFKNYTTKLAERSSAIDAVGGRGYPAINVMEDTAVCTTCRAHSIDGQTEFGRNGRSDL